MSDVDVHLNIAMTPRLVRGAFFLFLLTALPGELASESVTLNSYYPAPSGIYTQMITTGNTFLARDGGFVEVGTPSLVGGVGSLQAPANTTGINSTKLVVYGGYVGIGTASPTAWVHVQDSRNAPAVVAVNGQIITGTTTDPIGANNYRGMVYLNANLAGPFLPQYIGTNGNTMITMTNGYTALNVDNNGNVGIGPAGTAPQGQLDVRGVVLARAQDFTYLLP